ncbi:short-chain fatty acid transporter [Corallococcus carmarthensis]|uniref:Short-chain fatty acid transporter n=1 Tax=Corallococcus carmarthensis TaxID=2316728 RepID=A0A3A8KGX4_9BACT|nr:TIGR00366 family protein [Corallococcus carmarthensis]NOK18617.1 short-chain fatty acid transporter [Corallococcus carmarthensis]RKH01144.1 short-chain fatty acid transporter [Corallococcus carmarthensis]
METLVRFAEGLGRFSSRFVPSAFSIAVLLTLLTMALALGWVGAAPPVVLDAWGGGFWELLTFSMQMALVMFTGYLLALTAPVKALLEKVASLPRSPRSATALMAAVSMALAYFNWGLSLVASAMLVRFIARRRPDVDYRLLVACAYFGLGATWHAGLSASAPLLVATPGHFLEKQLGVIPIDRTLFSPFNIGLTLAAVALLTALAWALHPSPERTVRVEPAVLEKLADFVPPAKPQGRLSPAEWLDHAWLLNVVFGVLGLAWFGRHLWLHGGWKALNLNVVNFTFLTLAVLLHGTPARLLKASEEAASVLHGIVLQFPLYAGIYGIFKATGLTDRIGELFVSLSTQQTFPAIVYLYSGVVNYFVPSGGSKWAIEAPYLLDAAGRLGVAPEKVVLAYAWGDMATDLIQPFWALPLLAVARLEFKDILGFLLVAFLAYLPLVTLGFFLFG